MFPSELCSQHGSPWHIGSKTAFQKRAATRSNTSIATPLRYWRPELPQVPASMTHPISNHEYESVFHATVSIQTATHARFPQEWRCGNSNRHGILECHYGQSAHISTTMAHPALYNPPTRCILCSSVQLLLVQWFVVSIWPEFRRLLLAENRYFRHANDPICYIFLQPWSFRTSTTPTRSILSLPMDSWSQ